MTRLSLARLHQVSLAILVALTAMLGLTMPASADDKLSAEEIVIESAFTIEKMREQEQFGPYFQRYLKDARAVVVVPTMLKGGFIIGGEGGSGVVMARAQNNDWSYPSFLSVGSASIGIQFGGQRSELVLLVMTNRGLEAILKDQVQIGGELNGAIGPYGAGAEASTTTNLDVDVLAYSIASGAFLGVGIEGTALVPRESYNRAYYGIDVSPQDIVYSGAVGNPHADALRETLRKHAGP